MPKEKARRTRLPIARPRRWHAGHFRDDLDQFVQLRVAHELDLDRVGLGVRLHLEDEHVVGREVDGQHAARDGVAASAAKVEVERESTTRGFELPTPVTAIPEPRSMSELPSA